MSVARLQTEPTERCAKTYLIEDDEDQSTIIEQVLMAGGYEVTLLERSSDQLLSLERSEPCVLLLSVNSETLDDVDKVAAYAHLQSALTCLVLSDPADFELAMSCLTAGADGYLRKPIDETELLHAVMVAHRQAATKALQITTAWELCEARDRYHDLINNAPIALTLKDRNARFVVTNGRFEELYGQNGQSSIGKSPHDLFSEVTTKTLDAMDEEVLATGSVISREIELTVDGNDSRTVLMTKYPVRDRDGRTVGSGTISLDETLRVALERQLRKFKFSVDHGVDMVTWYDRQGRIVYANQSFCDRLGYSAEQALTLSMSDLCPDDTRRDFNEEAWRELKQHGSLNYETTRRELDGTEFPVEVILNHMDVGGDGLASCIMRDVSARKEAGELSNLLFDMPLVGAAYSSPKTGWIRVNDSLCEMLGYSREELLSLNWQGVTHPGDLVENQALIKQVTKDPHGHYRADKRFIHKDGSTVYVQVYSQFSRRDDGTPENIVGIVLNDTDRILAEKSLRESEAQLQRSQRMEAVGRLAGGIAHDFNNLLAVIMGNLELADALVPDGELKPMIADALNATRRGAHLTRQILSYGRQSTLKPERVELNLVISATSEMLRRVFPPSIAIETQLRAKNALVEIDRSLFETALLNLALNARDAMPEGGKLSLETEVITVPGDTSRLGESSLDGPCVSVTIRDTGSGMPPDVIEKAIDPFFTTKGVGEGSGLGLSMVYGFLEQSGGELRIQSTVGQGTSVNLYFVATGGARIQNQLPNEDPMPQGDDREHLLVVEDQSDVRSVLVRQLRGLGYSVIEAVDGKSALEALRSDAPINLVLTDILMPGTLQGHDVAAQVRVDRPGIKVIALTGEPGNTDADIFDFQLGKPLNQGELAKAVRTALDGDVT